MPDSVDNILICGSGLAFELAITALSYKLPHTIKITALELSDCDVIDAFYGHVTSPDTSSFNRHIGIEEPEFLLRTDTSFSYGTHYHNWAKKDWVQCHHLPFPVWENVPFIHYLTRSHKTLEPYLVNAECGKSHAFAHPPADKNVPLSRAEYGYQIRPQSLAQYYASQSSSQRITRVKGSLESLEQKEGEIKSISLTNGRTFTADFFVDATGQSGLLMEVFENRFLAETTLCAEEQVKGLQTPLYALRQLEGHNYGWQSQTTLRDKQITFTISDPNTKKVKQDNASTQQSFVAHIGRREKGWSGNCAALGHASHVIDPLTPAPIMLLQRDILRLLSLIPVSKNMKIEAREFNRLRQDDLDHANIFHRAFFETPDTPNTPYWKTVTASPIPQKLKRKIDQFESRGFLTNYDLDPFNEQDWAIQHFGIGRKPRRYDVFIERLSQATIDQNLDHMRQTIKSMAVKVPPHDRYLTKFIQYLEKKNHAAQY